MGDQKKFFTRMGDGSPVYMTEEEIRADIKAGIDDAVLRGKIDPLSEEDTERIYEIVTMPGNIVGVQPGMEIVTPTTQGQTKSAQSAASPLRETPMH